jgi:hypothetical protein
MMSDDVMIEMMSKEFLLWRCLHGGSLSKDNIDQPEPHPACDWPAFRARNLPLLEKLTDVYGACVVVARDGESIVGTLRFYPRAVCDLAAPEPAMCMQQLYPAGPKEDFVSNDFPSLDKIGDKTLFVHCMMTGSPKKEKNPYQRKGIASRMVRELIDWARRQGWSAVEAHAYADLSLWYAVSGQAGKMFWEKLGFHVVDSTPEPALVEDVHKDFVEMLLREAAERGIAPETAKTRYTMRLDLV